MDPVETIRATTPSRTADASADLGAAVAAEYARTSPMELAKQTMAALNRLGRRPEVQRAVAGARAIGAAAGSRLATAALTSVEGARDGIQATVALSSAAEAADELVEGYAAYQASTTAEERDAATETVNRSIETFEAGMTLLDASELPELITNRVLGRQLEGLNRKLDEAHQWQADVKDIEASIDTTKEMLLSVADEGNSLRAAFENASSLPSAGNTLKVIGDGIRRLNQRVADIQAAIDKLQYAPAQFDRTRVDAISQEIESFRTGWYADTKPIISAAAAASSAYYQLCEHLKMIAGLRDRMPSRANIFGADARQELSLLLSTAEAQYDKALQKFQPRFELSRYIDESDDRAIAVELANLRDMARTLVPSTDPEFDASVEWHRPAV